MEKVSTFSERLKETMLKEGLKQVDVIRLCKPIADKYGVQITQSLISQYMNCSREPRTLRLRIIAEVLGVNSLWLSGYDVNRDEIEYQAPLTVAEPRVELPVQRFVDIYRLLGYTIEENHGGYLIKKGLQKVHINDQRELMYKFHVLEAISQGLLLNNMYAQTDDVVKLDHRHFA